MNSKPASEIKVGDIVCASDGFEFTVTKTSWTKDNKIRITAHSDFAIIGSTKTFTVKPFQYIRISK